MKTYHTDIPHWGHVMYILGRLIDDGVSVCTELLDNGHYRLLVEEKDGANLFAVSRVAMMTQPPTNRVLVEVHGGVVTRVYSDHPDDVEVIVYDHDNIEAGDEPPNLDEGNEQVLPLTEFER